MTYMQYVKKRQYPQWPEPILILKLYHSIHQLYMPTQSECEQQNKIGLALRGRCLRLV